MNSCFAEVIVNNTGLAAWPPGLNAFSVSLATIYVWLDNFAAYFFYYGGFAVAALCFVFAIMSEAKPKRAKCFFLASILFLVAELVLWMIPVAT